MNSSLNTTINTLEFKHEINSGASRGLTVELVQYHVMHTSIVDINRPNGCTATQ